MSEYSVDTDEVVAVIKYLVDQVDDHVEQAQQLASFKVAGCGRPLELPSLQTAARRLANAAQHIYNSTRELNESLGDLAEAERAAERTWAERVGHRIGENFKENAEWWREHDGPPLLPGFRDGVGGLMAGVLDGTTALGEGLAGTARLGAGLASGDQETRTRLRETADYIADNPGEFVSGAVRWDLLRQGRFAEWIGNALPSVAAGGATSAVAGGTLRFVGHWTVPRLRRLPTGTWRRPPEVFRRPFRRGQDMPAVVAGLADTLVVGAVTAANVIGDLVDTLVMRGRIGRVTWDGDVATLRQWEQAIQQRVAVLQRQIDQMESLPAHDALREQYRIDLRREMLEKLVKDFPDMRNLRSYLRTEQGAAALNGLAQLALIAGQLETGAHPDAEAAAQARRDIAIAIRQIVLRIQTSGT